MVDPLKKPTLFDWVQQGIGYRFCTPVCVYIFGNIPKMIQKTDVIGFKVLIQGPKQNTRLGHPTKVMVNPKRSDLTCWLAHSECIRLGYRMQTFKISVFSPVFLDQACGQKCQDQYLVIGLDHQWFLRNIHEGLAVSDTFPLKCNARWRFSPGGGWWVCRYSLWVTTRETNNHLFSVSSTWRFFREVVDLESEKNVFFLSLVLVGFLKQHLVEGWNLYLMKPNQKILAKGEAKAVRFAGKWCNACFRGKNGGGLLGWYL